MLTRYGWNMVGDDSSLDAQLLTKLQILVAGVSTRLDGDLDACRARIVAGHGAHGNLVRFRAHCNLSPFHTACNGR